MRNSMLFLSIFSLVCVWAVDLRADQPVSKIRIEGKLQLSKGDRIVLISVSNIRSLVTGSHATAGTARLEVDSVDKDNKTITKIFTSDEQGLIPITAYRCKEIRVVAISDCEVTYDIKESTD